MANITKRNDNITLNKNPNIINSGKSKIPTPANITTAIKKIKPMKNAFIFIFASSLANYSSLG